MYNTYTHKAIDYTVPQKNFKIHEKSTYLLTKLGAQYSKTLFLIFVSDVKTLFKDYEMSKV